MERLRYIDCKCGCWEEMPHDEQRHHSQSFQWVQNIGEQGKYLCICGKFVISTTNEEK